MFQNNIFAKEGTLFLSTRISLVLINKHCKYWLPVEITLDKIQYIASIYFTSFFCGRDTEATTGYVQGLHLVFSQGSLLGHWMILCRAKNQTSVSHVRGKYLNLWTSSPTPSFFLFLFSFVIREGISQWVLKGLVASSRNTKQF